MSIGLSMPGSKGQNYYADDEPAGSDTPQANPTSGGTASQPAEPPAEAPTAENVAAKTATAESNTDNRSASADGPAAVRHPAGLAAVLREGPGIDLTGVLPKKPTVLGAAGLEGGQVGVARAPARLPGRRPASKGAMRRRACLESTAKAASLFMSSIDRAAWMVTAARR